MVSFLRCLGAGVINLASVNCIVFTLNKSECSKQALRLNDCAWDNGTGRLRPFIGLSGDVMIDRNGRRDSYERVKGEIFRSFSDGRMRRRFTRTFSLIKSERSRFEND